MKRDALSATMIRVELSIIVVSDRLPLVNDAPSVHRRDSETLRYDASLLRIRGIAKDINLWRTSASEICIPSWAWMIPSRSLYCTCAGAAIMVRFGVLNTILLTITAEPVMH